MLDESIYGKSDELENWASPKRSCGAARKEGVPFGDELAVASVYELAEPVAKLLPDGIGRS